MGETSTGAVQAGSLGANFAVHILSDCELIAPISPSPFQATSKIVRLMGTFGHAVNFSTGTPVTSVNRRAVWIEQRREPLRSIDSWLVGIFARRANSAWFTPFRSIQS